jgi:hypothetical protein
MASLEGNISKMKTSLSGQVFYELPIGNGFVSMNQLVGTKISMTFLHQINCMHCGAKTSKSFAQGYCYKCFISAPETSDCVLRPELCQAHLGISRDMEWAKGHCLTDHYVYLAISSGLKVGVTRASQVPTRWIDQGAWKAIKLAQTPHRQLAGQIETALKKHISDKTHWQKMLKNVLADDISLIDEKQKAWELLEAGLQQYVIEDDTIVEIHYPVIAYPEKVTSMSFDKTTEIEGFLQGIKGQYLIFDGGRVLNIRTHSGYMIQFSY